MCATAVYFDDVVCGIGRFATAVAGWVVGKQCLSVASVGQVICCVFSGHKSVISLMLFEDVMLVLILCLLP